MSRVGKKPVDIPSGVKVEVKDSLVVVESSKGKLEYKIKSPIKVSVLDKRVIVKLDAEEPTREDRALFGLTRTIISNLIKGVTEGYKKELEIRGVGFKAQVQGQKLQMTLGFSHPVVYEISEGVTVATPKPTIIIVSGMDKVKVGEVSAEIRDFFRAEPYTGKGIRYLGEYVRHKAGKTVVK